MTVLTWPGFHAYWMAPVIDGDLRQWRPLTVGVTFAPTLMVAGGGGG